MPIRECIDCGFKLLSESNLHLFVRNPGSKYGYRNLCKKCSSDRRKNSPTYYEDNKTIYVRNKYGVTVEEYDECMSTSTCCEHCGKTENLCYDHDHNKIGVDAFRGVLCRECNSALGKLGDTKEDIERLLQYLSK